MSIEKMREEFESWQAKETPGADLQHCGALIGSGPARESYRNMYVAERWIGWQASRESLVIALPHAWTGRHKMTGDPLPHGLMNSTEVREAIEAAGLKVKL